MASRTTEESLKQYEAEFRSADRDYYDRHLVFDHVVTTEQVDQRQRFEAMARSLRDLLTQRWLLTQSIHERANLEQVYYLSMEFLIGRSLLSTVTNMEVQSFVDEDLRSDPFELFIPRHLEIIYEINARFLRDVRTRYPGDEDRVRRMSLIEETPARQVRMANLAIVGTLSVGAVDVAAGSSSPRTRGSSEIPLLSREYAHRLRELGGRSTWRASVELRPPVR